MKSEIKRKLISVLFPERCPYCREVVKPCEIACEECKEILPSHVYTKNIVGGFKVLSAVPYRDSFSAAILKVKFGKKKQYAYQLANLMTEKLKAEGENINYDVITFVPLHPVTFKERGFNQSELLARCISETLNIPCEALLKKTKKNEPQHNLRADKREKNVKGVFRPTDKSLIKDKKILLIDDIVTTGFTLAECAKVLSEKGAEEVFCLTFAITLPKTT